MGILRFALMSFAHATASRPYMLNIPSQGKSA